MKFCEKLQKLRKEKGYSQEQLADLLDVSRQSVSKWESGTTYPEMDKLLSLCKIFNVSLDDLTNDDITDRNILEKKKNNFSNIFNSMLEMINRSVEMFRKMNKLEIAKCITELIILFLILLLLRIPFNYINNSIENIFVNFSLKAFNILNSIWLFLSNTIYLILFITIFIYIYKIRFLDKYENNGYEEKIENNITNEEKISEKKVIKEEKHTFVLFSVLGRLFNIFIKICLLLILIPILLFFIFTVIMLVFSIIVQFIGIHFIGISLTLLALSIILAIIIELLIRFLLNSRLHVSRMFIIFISSLTLFGIGCGISTFELTKIKYIDEVPINNSIVNNEYIFDMNDNLKFSISDYYDKEVIIDNSLGDKIKVNIESYEDYVSYNIDIINNYLSIYTYVPWNKAMNYFELLKSNLVDNKIYNYNELSKIKIYIYISEENLNIINNNMEEINALEDYYNEEIERLENENSLKDEKIYELELKIEELEEKITNINNLTN